MPKDNWRQRWRWLLYPLAMLGLVWTVWLLWDALPELKQSLLNMEYRWLAITLAGMVVSGYLNFEAFRVVFCRVNDSAYGRRQLGHLYFTGQLMKHLPGRVWGVAYQSTMGGRISLASWVSITITYMVLTMGFALWASTVVIGSMQAVHWGLVAFVTGLIIYTFVWHPKPLQFVLRAMRCLPGGIFLKLSQALLLFTDVTRSFKLWIALWFGVGWIIYFSSWVGFGLSWPGLSASDSVLLCAIYTVAWFVGYISLVTPSGLGVREVAFVLMASRFPPDAVAGMLVFARVALIFVDIFFGLIFMPFVIKANAGQGGQVELDN